MVLVNYLDLTLKVGCQDFAQLGCVMAPLWRKACKSLYSLKSSCD